MVRALKSLRNQNIMLCCLVLDTCGTGSTVWNRGSNNNLLLLLQVVASTTDSPKPNCECPRKHQPQEFAGTHKGDSTTINPTLTRLLLRVIFSVVHKVHSGCYSLKTLSCEGRVIRLCWASRVGHPVLGILTSESTIDSISLVSNASGQPRPGRKNGR